jgi:hypothetical protein
MKYLLLAGFVSASALSAQSLESRRPIHRVPGAGRYVLDSR